VTARRILRLPLLLSTLILGSFSFLSSSCGNNPGLGGFHTNTNSESQCKPRHAVVVVYDGFFENICGCQEPRALSEAIGGGFRCTVSTGSTVVFLISKGLRSQHQLLPVGTPAINPSALVDPIQYPNGLGHAVTLDAPGTYQFQDAFFPGSLGELVAL
jgi:hypothetical protein